MQQTVNQLVTKAIQKRCLIGLQKGVSKGLKGHLLKAKRALIERQFTPFWISILEFYLQCLEHSSVYLILLWPSADNNFEIYSNCATCCCTIDFNSNAGYEVLLSMVRYHYLKHVCFRAYQNLLSSPRGCYTLYCYYQHSLSGNLGNHSPTFGEE